jgi:hypothetical protein
LSGGAGRWTVALDDGAAEGPFERLVVAAPAPQTAALLDEAAPTMARQAGRADYAACMSAIATLPAGPALDDGDDWRAYDDPVLAVALRDSAKPGRAATHPATWVLHATTAWSEAHQDDPHDQIAQALWDAFAVQQPELPAPTQLIGHRWRYARVTRPLEQDCLFDADLGLGACGDWCLGPDAGDALLSGFAMAGRLFAAEPALAARGRPPAEKTAA